MENMTILAFSHLKKCKTQMTTPEDASCFKACEELTKTWHCLSLQTSPVSFPSGCPIQTHVNGFRPSKSLDSTYSGKPFALSSSGL